MDEPKYELWILRQSGPDDADWDLDEEFILYSKCIMKATDYHDKGFQVKIFDPFMGKAYNFPNDF